MRVSAIVVAAGSGQRLGANLPKALVPLCGRPLYEWAAIGMSAHPQISTIVLVVPRDVVDLVAAVVRDDSSSTGRCPVEVIAGGATRQQSVALGLAVSDPTADAVLVHDAARPLVPADVVTRVIAALANGAAAVVPVVAVADTIKRVDPAGVVIETVDRDMLRAVQTPQGFRRSLLVAVHESQRQAVGAADAGPTDDAGLVEAAGVAVTTVAGSELSFKITTPHDLRVAEAVAAEGALPSGAVVSG